MPNRSLVATLAVLAVAAYSTEAFAPAATSLTSVKASSAALTPLFAEESPEAVFKPLDEPESEGAEGDIDLSTVEMLGRGAAKAKRGKRKGGPVAKNVGKDKASVTLAPEEVHYEGPPAITETIIPTVSILSVVGIIPAIASWSRQVWVRYKITTRRIRVTSGIGGKDMAEIVYPDIVEMRTVKRLFGDGDMVAFLRDGAKFEMRNIPDFDETVKFILEQVSPDVKKQYLEGGDVTRPQE
uniref:YdbS-like PH domain-containing protein n=1 Tax=Pseudo-nitzschia australis TaxID=44445 RepID=A0A7S4EI92_9STRA|mmetsp:Transcript_10569/g.22568  ORF Transcript_10569/g.22568 Transcript_10569/m.22568 type:complete len:240 (+) Transcript_10569:148-867(+)